MITCPECNFSHILSANYKGDNEVKPGTVHKYSGIFLEARRPSYEGCATSHRLKWGPLLKIIPVGLHCTSGREKKGNQEKNGERFWCSYFKNRIDQIRKDIEITGENGKKYKKTGSGRIEMAGDFSVIVEQYL